MPKIFDITPKGIKCDMPGCGWHDDTVVFDRATCAVEWLNRPCPSCHGNLYTQRDLELVKRLYKMVDRINFWFGWLHWVIPGSKEWRSIGGFGSDGRGVITQVEAGTPLAEAVQRRAKRGSQ